MSDLYVAAVAAFLAGAVVSVLLSRIYRRKPARTAIEQEYEQTDTEEAVCRNCRFFELEGAQQAMRRNPAFMRVMEAMSPYENGRRSVARDNGPCPDCDPAENLPCTTCSGDRRLIRYENVYPTGIPANAQWSEYGWCTHNALPRERAYNEFTIWGGAAFCEGKLFQLRKKPNLRMVG